MTPAATLLEATHLSIQMNAPGSETSRLYICTGVYVVLRIAPFVALTAAAVELVHFPPRAR